MTDIQKIATTYIDLWNERAADRRREILKQNWTDDASYIDPLMSGDGRDGSHCERQASQNKAPHRQRLFAARRRVETVGFLNE